LEQSSAQREKQGTGFLINNEGYVVTNFHVIDGAKEITVKGIKGDYNTPFQLDVVAVDRQLDLALLKINTKLITFETPPYAIGKSKILDQASDIFALGYPMKSTMGNEIKVTTGIVNSTSGFKGSISEFQISASVQPGNSGGPLLDKDGNIVGVVSAKIKSKEVDNVGYAIKSDYLTFFLEQIGDIEFKKEAEKLEETDLSTKVKQISNFVYIIETK
jgi:S1-C subfamily serine protease